jgi:post-segregation antitoxin (ccd killing protein)
MPDKLSERDLIAELQKQAPAAGLNVHANAQHGLSGEAERIGAKWWLGGRNVTYHMSCNLTEADRTVHFREDVVERSWASRRRH